jgi:hypothetical protein
MCLAAQAFGACTGSSPNLVAATCSQSDIQACVTAAAASGDTITILSGGSVTYGATPITISGKSLTLNLAGCTMTSAAAPNQNMISVSTNSTASTRITNATLITTGVVNDSEEPIIFNTNPGDKPFRFDHSNLSMNDSGTLLDTKGNGPGLIDHNTFTGGGAAEMIHNFALGPSSTAGWSDDIVPGSYNAVYIENNTFNNTSTSVLAKAIENYYGARTVFRNNTLNFSSLDAHGNSGNSATPSTRWVEIYNNTSNTNGHSQCCFFTIRGGSGVMFGNVENGANGGAGSIQFQEDIGDNFGGTCSPPDPYPYHVGSGITSGPFGASTPFQLWAVDANMHPGGDGCIRSGVEFIVNTNQPSTMPRCESAADVTAGCSVNYSYTPFTYPYPLTAAGLPNPNPAPPRPQQNGPNILGPVQFFGGTSIIAAGGTSNTFLSENLYCAPGDIPLFGATDGPATLPQACIYTAMSGSPSPGSPITASTASALTSALSSVTCGQTIIIPATSTITGTFTLPALGCDISHWITIRTDQINNANFPAEAVRATPCSIGNATTASYPAYSCPSPAVLMPTIQTSTANTPVFTGAAGCNFYRLIGLNITSTTGAGINAKLFSFSNGCDHVIIDRSLLHAPPVNCSQTAGVYTCDTTTFAQGAIGWANSTYMAVVSSWLYDTYCISVCVDSQGIGGGTNAGVGTGGGGPYKAFNNLIASSGETWLFGGSGATATPCDFEFRRNHSFKPLSWMLANNGSGTHPIIKNLGEMKNGCRILYEGNMFENNWAGFQTDQTGFTILMTPKNQGNSIHVTGSFAGGVYTASSGTPFTSDMAGYNLGIDDASRSDNGVSYPIVSVDPSDTFVTVSGSPPNGAVNFAVACHPGLCPTCHDDDITIRYNETRNTRGGATIATARTTYCHDESNGMNNVSVHDNLFQGMDNRFDNGGGTPGSASDCFYVENGQYVYIMSAWTVNHNTCIHTSAGANSLSSMQVLDLTNNPPTITPGAYFANMIYTNNIDWAAWMATYKSGTLFPGGALAGLNQEGCPNHDGLNCTWVQAKNIFGIGQYTNQVVNKPYAATNADPGDTPAGGGCGTAQATCFPNGAAFNSLFVNWNNGYLGDYHLAPGSPYKLQGTDGLDIGANISLEQAATAGVAQSVTYTPISITTTTLPNGTNGTAYSQTLLASGGASDFQNWFVQTGTLPAGLALSRYGLLSGTPTASGTSSFTVIVYDGARQTSTQNLSLTIN